jgi:intracellular sulfur oxidation DsrE/DsrF family protein
MICLPPLHQENRMMTRILIATITVVAMTHLMGCATTGVEMPGGTAEMKLAFDFTDTNPVVLLNKLNNVDVTRKQLIASGVTPKIVMTFRGNASFFTQTNLAAVKESERADALKVADKLRELGKAPGVQALEQCNLPLADRKLSPADLMQEVKLVPNGWIALGAYQRQGYAYIAP